jgi:alcohol dehydrogenase class IV
VLSERERAFSWRDGARLIRFGCGALTDAPELLTTHCFEGYVLLCTRRALDSADGAGALAEGADAVLEVPSGGVPDAAASVRGEVGGHPLVALGGGRVLDSAKAIAAVDGLRCAAVPTTLSGAEVTTIHRLPSGAERAGLVRPALVIADPELMASAPTPALTATAMNALAHGAEALYAPGANPVGELTALRGAELIAAGLETPEPDRESLALGALLCAWAIDGAGLGMHHALCQTIVRLTGAAHAETNAVVLPAVLRYLAPHVRRELGRLAAALGADDDDPQLAAERAGALAAGTKVAGLSELGVREDQLEAVIEAVLRRPELAGAPGSPGSEEVRKLLSGVL